MNTEFEQRISAGDTWKPKDTESTQRASITLVNDGTVFYGIYKDVEKTLYTGLMAQAIDLFLSEWVPIKSVGSYDVFIYRNTITGEVLRLALPTPPSSDWVLQAKAKLPEGFGLENNVVTKETPSEA